MTSYFNLIPVSPGTPSGDYLERRGVWGKVLDQILSLNPVPFRPVIPLSMERRVRALAKLGPKTLKYFSALVQSSTGIDLRRWFNVPGCKLEEILIKSDCTWSYLVALGLGRIQPKTNEIKATSLAFHPHIQFLSGLTTSYEQIF